MKKLVGKEVKMKVKAKKNEVLKQKRTLCEVYSRVVGYLRPVSQWNSGKEEEFSQRRTYKLN